MFKFVDFHSVYSRLCLAVCWLVLTLEAASAANVRSSIIFVKGEPHLEVKLDSIAAAAGPKPIDFSFFLFNKDGNYIWTGRGKLERVEGKPLSTRMKLQKLTDARSAHHVEIEFHRPDLQVSSFELIRFAAEDAAIQAYGIRRFGNYPDEKLKLFGGLNKARKPKLEKVDFNISLRDVDDNVVFKKVESVQITNALTDFDLDITPDDQSTGPFSLECSIDDEANGIAFNWTERLAFSNALVPVTSFEINDNTWFVAPADPYHMRGGYAGSDEITKIVKPTMKSYSRYYSPQLYPDKSADYPAIQYDDKTKRSGEQSLRIEYRSTQTANVWSMLTLPGAPLMARFWVKGNQTKDRLVVHWRDQTDLMRAGWGRFASWTHKTVGTLDFEGWKEFRVPVLGLGLQVKSYSGNTQDIDLPIYLLALTIHPQRGKEPESRTLWLDDIFAETQARVQDRLKLELRTDTSDRLLHPDAAIFVSIENGSGRDIKPGRLQVQMKDRNGKSVRELSEQIEVPANSVRVRRIPLKEVSEKKPEGPIEITATFADIKTHGLRTSDLITLKSARSSALIWDFEKGGSYNGYKTKTGSSTVAGGADGSKRSLYLEVEGKPLTEEEIKRLKQRRQPVPTQTINRCLLHPALPGMPDRIEMMLKGGTKTVWLDPILVDAGRAGVMNKNENEFWLPRIKVDWQDWRKVELVAPPVPNHFGDKERFFFRQPWYPLNLVFQVAIGGKEKSGVFIDNIRLRTHLPKDEELQVQVDYPDDSRIHPPGAPLKLLVTNFSSEPKTLNINFSMESYQQRTAASGSKPAVVRPGEKIAVTLVESLKPGIFTLVAEAEGQKRLSKAAIESGTIMVLDSKEYFGDKPLEFLGSMPEIRRSLDSTIEDIYLDWDNSEPVPGLYHYHWFAMEGKKKSTDGAYELRPVVGFSADWSGRESQDAIAKARYVRYMANHLQVPVRMRDWSHFVRQMVRKYKGRFRQWVFWENADLKDAPQHIPPATYPIMLSIFKKWVDLYDPKAEVIAGGFNMDKTLEYLESIEEPSRLEFDRFGVRMNVGELSPEDADVEGFLDELNSLLKLKETGRKVEVSVLDWGIGGYVTPAQQAAYHARASLILDSRGAEPHRFSFINFGLSYEGYGIFYRTQYGNSENVQTFKPIHVPKPAYFSLRHTRDFLARWKFLRGVQIPDANREANRAFIYWGDQQRLAVVLWRTLQEARLYRMPSGWKGAKARDAFGFPVDLTKGLQAASLPTFIELPAGSAVDQITYDLRVLRPSDGRDVVLLDLHLNEPDSCKRAGYFAKGETTSSTKPGKVPGGAKLKEVFSEGIEAEQFDFVMARAANILVSRRWHFDGTGQKIWIKLNDGEEESWDLTRGKANYPSLRESTFILRNAGAGKNRIAIRYEKPGNCSGYRVEQLPGDSIDLVRWGILNAAQSRGELQRYKSASGSPLTIGKESYRSGLGAHAVSYIEYPLDGLFKSFEVTVGIDGVTDGRGSVIFQVLADGQEKVNSGLVSGFSKPKRLKLEGLENTRRLLIIVNDAGDGNQDDLANLVDGKLVLK